MITCALTETSSAETDSSATISLRLDRKSTRDADALALAAGEFVRVAARHVGHQTDAAQEFGDRRGASDRRCELVDQTGLGDGGADRHARIEARERILEDHLHVLAPLAQVVLVQPARLRRRAGPSRLERFDQSHDRAPGGRLAAAGFADQRQRLAGLQLKDTFSTAWTRAGHAAEQAGADLEARGQVLHLEHRPLAAPTVSGVSVGTSDSPVSSIDHRKAHRALSAFIEPSFGTAESSARV